MGALYWSPDNTRMRSFTSSSKGGATTIRIELSVTDPVNAGFILNDLAEIDRAERAVAKPKAAAPKGPSHA